MKVTIKPSEIVVPPPTVVIEMPLESAKELLACLNQVGVGGADKDGKCSLYGPVCELLPEEVTIADKLYGGHSWKYKRVIDALVNHMRLVIGEKW
jgi:hypothetical protein